MEFLTDFTQNFSPRVSGTDEEKVAADFLAEELAALGYDVAIQPFTVDLVSSELQILSPPDLDIPDIRNLPLRDSSTGTQTGIMVSVGGAFEDDIPEQGLTGKIALIERGSITFETKVRRVAAAGAIAAVIYNDDNGLFRGSLANVSAIPAVSISRESGEELLGLLNAGEVEVTVSVSNETRNTRNVVAEKPGTDDDGGVVILGGHFDTVADVPGASDNGSGIATLITIAREVASREYPFTLRFIPFGSEELGLRGSQHYVDSLTDEERDSLIVMLNLDALATGEVAGLLGDFDLIAELRDFGSENGIEVAQRFSLEGATSDHASFEAVGVPVVFFLSDDFSRIHTPEDKLEFVQPELMGQHATLALQLLEILAQR